MKKWTQFFVLFVLVWMSTTYAQPTLVSPADGATGQPTTITFDWNADGAATQYRIQVSTDPTFLDAGAMFYNQNIGNLLTKTLSGFSTYTTYYWHVRSNLAGTPYSETRSFRIIDVLPTDPSNLAPNVTVVTTLTPDLSWTASTSLSTVSYTININGHSQSGITGNSFPVPGGWLSAGANYDWDVTAVNEAGNSATVNGNFDVLANPSAFTLLTPVNNDINIPVNDITFDWNTSTPGTITYKFELSDDYFANILFTQNGIIGTTFTYNSPNPNLEFYKDYQWRVTAVNEIGNTVSTYMHKFRTTLAGPVLSYPVSGSIGHPLTPSLLWAALANSSEYQLQISTVNTFLTTVYDVRTTNLFKDIPSGILSDNITYYWRVRGIETLGGTDYGTWSAVWNFKVVNGTVPTPNLAWPIGGTTTYLQNQMLSWWVGVAGNFTYQVQFSTSSDFESVTPIVNTTTSDLFYTVNNLSSSTTYYWRVRTYNTSSGIYGSFSTVESFFTDPSIGPVIPTPSYPTGGTIVWSTSPTLYWYSGAAPLTLTYDIEYNTNGVFSGTPTVSGLGVQNYSLSGLTPGQTYYWKVRSALTGHGTSAWSSTATFTVDNSVGNGPVTPYLSYPTNGAMVYTTTPQLNWYLGVHRTGLTYEIQIKEGSAPVDGDPFVTSSFMYYTPAALNGGSTYYWRVRSTDGFTFSDWTASETFEVYSSGGTGVSVPVPSWPIGGAVCYSINPTINWYLSTWVAGLTYELRYGIATGVYTTTLPSSYMYLQLTGLQPGTTYYYQVRSYNGIIYSDWSAEESFKTTPGTGLSIPNLSYPTDGAIVYTTAPTLYWWCENYIGVVSYRVKVSLNPDMTGYTSYTPTNTNQALTGLVAGATYYWTVESYDGTNYSAPSDIESFTVNPGTTSAVTPITGNPVGGMILNSSTPRLSWYLPVNQSGLTYELQYSKTAAFDNPVTITNISSTSKVVEGIESNKMYYWRVKSMKNGESSTYSAAGKFGVVNGITAVEDETSVIPDKFTVDQNFPNPFNPSTTIRFGLAKDSRVSVKIYNMLGQEIKTLLTEDRKAGTYRLTWYGDNNVGQKVSSGTYIYRVIAGNEVQTFKMILIK